jgi:glycosyltransferase involved in cell wall biosynthesis
VSRTRILVISRSNVGSRMSAPGIRALHTARTLARVLPEAEVTFAIPNTEDQPRPDGYRLETYTRRTLPGLILKNDVIVSQYVPAYAMPFVTGKRLVLDFFANFIAEWLELWTARKLERDRAALLDTDRRYLNLQLSQADLVLAANERQRDLWLGTMAAIGRITPDVYDADPSLRSLVDVASFGIRPEPPVARKRVLKGVYPGIGEKDTVLLWNGGVLSWYDPETLLHAFARVARERSELKLFFLGTKYPVPDPIEGESVNRMIALSDKLGLTGRNVFFNEGWVTYDDSADYLVEADIGVSCYFDNLETHFAQRVRLIDLIWSETPIICSEGDTVSDLVRERELGVSVPYQDADAIEAAIRKLLDSKERARCQENIRNVKPELTWEYCLRPLIRFCRELPESSSSRSTLATSFAAASYGWGRVAQIGSKAAKEATRSIQARRSGARVPSPPHTRPGPGPVPTGS